MDDDLQIEIADDDQNADALHAIAELVAEMTSLVDGLDETAREEVMHRLDVYAGVLRKLRDQVAVQAGGTAEQPVKMSRAAVAAVLNSQFLHSMPEESNERVQEILNEQHGPKET